jgi:AraC-like DNA-binding protein
VLNSLLSWLLALAAAQAVFVTASLLARPQPELRVANRLLAALLLTFGAIIGHAWLGLNGLYPRYPHSALAIMTLGLLTGPLLYLYLKVSLSGDPLGPRELLHFLPFGLAALAMMPFYLESAEEKLAWMRQLHGMPWYLGLAAAIKTAAFLLYVRSGHQLIQHSPSTSALKRGLGQLSGIWVIGGVLSVAALAMELADAHLPVTADAVGGIALMAFVFATAFMAMRQPLGYRTKAPALPEPAPRYSAKRFSTSDADAFLARLKACMEQEQAFRDGELKLEYLAERVAMTPHELSQLINDTCDMNFSDYVNRYRVEDLKRALRDPAQVGGRILDLALAAGFNSKSAMNRVFKVQTGMTPGEFRSRAGLLGEA